MIDFNKLLGFVEGCQLKARRGLAICLAIAAAGTLCNVAVAQQAGLPASASPNNDHDQLQEVTVTAERRTVDLQAAAVSMSVRTGDDLAAHGKAAVAEYLEDVPSVVVAVPTIGNAIGVSDSPSWLISIRGVGSNGLPPGSATSVVPAVAEYVDGVYSGIGSNYDIERVEVQRGPQGTLYGRSATGGVVGIVTRDPVVGQFSGTATAEIGDYNLRHFTAGINLPAGPVAALRVSGSEYSRDGYYAKEGGALHITDGRVKLLVAPTDDLTIKAGIALQSSIDRTGELGGSLTPADKIAYSQVLPLGTGHNDTSQVWAQINWNLGPATLTYVPTLRNWTMHGTVYQTPAPGATLTNNQATPYDQFHTEELRLSSNPGSRINWQTGVFFYDNDARATVNLVVTGPVFPPGGVLLQNSVTSHSTRNLGAFAEAWFPLTDTLGLTAGVRDDSTKVVTGETNTTGLGAGGTLVLPKSDGTRKWNNVTYKVRLEDKLTPSNLLYAAVSSAFLPGDVSISTGATGALAISPYQPETLTAFELGSKNRFLDERLQVNAAVFFYRYGGYQQSVQTGFIPPGIFLFSYANSPARMTGGELEILWQPVRSDQVGLNVSVLNPYYADKPPIFAVGVAQSKIPGIIPLTVNPSYSHIFTLGDSQTLTVRADALYNDNYDVYPITSAVAAQGGENYIGSGSHVVANLSATWAFASRDSLTIWARNITNQQFNNYVNISSIVPVVAAAGTLRDPRTFGVSLSLGF